MVDFLITKTKLLRYAGMQSFCGSSTASKVLNKMEPATFKKKPKPEKPELTVNMDDIHKEMKLLDYKVEGAKYMEDMKVHNVYIRK